MALTTGNKSSFKVRETNGIIKLRRVKRIRLDVVLQDSHRTIDE